MKLQGHEVKFTFKSTAKYDNYARKNGIRTTQEIVRSIANEIKRLELLHGKSFNKMNDEERVDFVIPMDTDEAQCMYYATINLPEKDIDALLEKEMQKKTVIEITAEIVSEFMRSPLFQAAAAKEKDENPKSPK